MSELSAKNDIRDLIDQFASVAAADTLGHPDPNPIGIVIDPEDDFAWDIAVRLAGEEQVRKVEQALCQPASGERPRRVLTVAGPAEHFVEVLTEMGYQAAAEGLFAESPPEGHVLVVVLAHGRATGVHVDPKMLE
jgi:hypothetical protein